MKDLPTQTEILQKFIDLGPLTPAQHISIMSAMDLYATLVRDKTLQVAAENADLKWVHTYPNSVLEIDKDSILSLKEHKDLQI